MGCNAWNHPPNCNCGWGGDTGGGFGTTWPQAPAVRLFNNSWPTVKMSITVPNASCPVCGAPVFFYESFSGGRVFFDELGPPWPKHPCTDNDAGRTGDRPIRTANLSPANGTREHIPQWRVLGWIVLDQASISSMPNYSVVRGNNSDNGSKVILGVTEHIRCTDNDPILVRKADDETGLWEISYFPINSRLANIIPETVKGFPRAQLPRDIELWGRALDGDPDARNLIGMSLSFARGVKADDGSWTFPDEPDWAAAELHFLMAAAAGRWAGFHNLGAMYRNGFGVRQDAELAFHFTLRAAEIVVDANSEASLKALSEMMELGWGTDDDRASADFILSNPPEVKD